MAVKKAVKKAAPAKPARDPAVPAPACGHCGAVECGTHRVAVCCDKCTH
jgi:hypothetical protein